MKTTFLLAFLAMAPEEPHAPTDLPTGIVDYLAHHGRASDFASRKRLFVERFGSAPPYRGSAAQNVRLRNRLVVEDYVPRVRASKIQVAEGAPVDFQLRVSSPQAVTVESGLLESCLDSTAGAIHLGPAKRGLFEVRLVGQHAAAEGVLVLDGPRGGPLTAELVLEGVAVLPLETAADQLAATKEAPSAEDALARLRRVPSASKVFMQKVTLEDFQSALPAGTKSYLREGGAVDATTTLVVCAVAGASPASPVTAPFAGLLARECGSQAAGNAVAFAPHLLRAVVSKLEATGRLAPADARALEMGLKALSLAKAGVFLSGAGKAPQRLEAAEAILSAMGEVVGQIESEPVRVIMTTLVAEGRKLVVVTRVSTMK